MQASFVLRIVVALFVLLASPLAAQVETTGWTAFPSFNSVTSVAAGSDAIWAGASGGVFSYAPESGEITRYTVVDGLNGATLTALAVDPEDGTTWAGFDDGVLNKIDPEARTITSVLDISRADQYASRGVRRLRFAGDSLLVATDFGLVVYDVERDETRDTYARFAAFSAATPVNDALVAPLADGRPGLWVATEEGLVSAPRNEGNLQVASTWGHEVAFEGSALSLGFFQGSVYVGGGPSSARDLYQRNASGGYERRLFINNPISEIVTSADRMVFVDPSSVWAIYGEGGRVRLRTPNPVASRMEALALSGDGRVWLGDAVAGLFAVPIPAPGGPDTETFTPEPVRPEGPLTSEFAELAVGPDQAVWIASRQLDGSAAVSKFADGAWTAFSRADVPALSNGPRSASAGPDGSFYFGSSGEGLIVFGADGEIDAYESGNSTLTSPSGAPGFVVVSDVGFEGDRRWVVNEAAPLPLHLFAADGTWTGLPYPPGVPSSNDAQRIAVDDFGQKWLTLRRVGLAVWDTGADPADPSDDRAVRIAGSGSNGQGLPDNDVRDVVADLDGGLWVGTARGIAYVFSPGSALEGNAAISWPIIAGTETQGADYLLRDVQVNDLEIDPAGRLWVATTTGAYLVSRSRDGLELAFDTNTSPLPSDDVQSVSVDRVSGTVYFATRQGLVAYQGDATTPQADATELAVTPSPFRPDQGDASVLVSGLNARESAVRILTVSGDVVFSQDVSGGAFRWDGIDERTRQPVASGVYLVVAAGTDGEGSVVGKIAVVR
ncbi:MAG: two-component regulator propeller domain-containing protein [Rubricoccaceae bacterium]